MRLKAAIFDLDGVLVFTDVFHYLAWKKLADSLGIYFDETINQRLRGVGRMESLEIILEGYNGPEFTQEQKKVYAEQKNQTYRELLSTMSPADVSIEVRDTLAELHRRGYRLAIGSSSKNAKFILQKTELYDVFDVVSDGTNITYSKPNPEVFVNACMQLCLQPEECLVIEDAVAGIIAGKSGGMKTAAIGDARNCSKTDYVIEQISDLLDILIE